MLRLLLKLPHIRQTRSVGNFLLLIVAVGAAALSQVTTAAAATVQQWQISDVIVNRVNIFTADQASENPLYRLVNRLHRTTTERTVVQELGVVPGDRLSVAQAAELERVLRKTGLFAAVTVRLVETEGQTDVAQLIVDTRDQVSIVAGANGSFLGGVGELGFTVGDRNVLGLGDSVTLSLSGNTDDEIRGALSYRDLHFGNRHTRALYQAGRTEEGDFALVQFSRPFKTELDRRAWSVLLENRQHDIDYYDNGYSVAQVPERRRIITLNNQRRRVVASGGSLRHGLAVSLRDLAYDEVTGSQAATISRPLDRLQVSASYVLGFDGQKSHRKLTGLDTLGFTQDLSFGLSSELQFGLRHNNYDGAKDEVSPVLSATVANALHYDRALMNFAVNTTATFNEQTTNWSSGATAKLYYRVTEHQVMASRLVYNKAKSEGQLPVQYTLGEDNGLRGYANRLLSGSERLQLNVEHRYKFNRRFGIFDAGVLGFVDLGWVGRDDGSDALKRSAGLGLRIGSSALLGRNVLRMDLAFPLDDDSGDTEPSLSVAVGQVFSF